MVNGYTRLLMGSQSHIADRSLSVSMTLSDLEGRDAIGQFFRRISVIPFIKKMTENDQFGKVRRREGRIPTGQPRPAPRSQRPPNF